MNNFPKNGRVAIVDDKIDQAIPLMNLFSRLQIPYVYYDGNQKNLPDVGQASNDVRLLFLDINLIDNATHTDKVLKSKLFSTINRIISDKNYPYILLFWSRHEKEHGKMVKELFANELKTKAPISYFSLKKSDYIELTGGLSSFYEEKVPELFAKIQSAVNEFPVYSHLLEWENLVHTAADKTIEEVFKLDGNGKQWDTNSQYLFYKLANGYSGKNLKDQLPAEQLRSGFYSLNFVFNDALEYSISNSSHEIAMPNVGNPLYTNENSLYYLNKRILFSDEKSDRLSPGIIYESSKIPSDQFYHDYDGILINWLDRNKYSASIHKQLTIELKGLKGKARIAKKKSLESKKLKAFRDIIREDWKKVEVNITPICDYVQGKCVYHRLVPGIIVNKKYLPFFSSTSEAVYISPNFKMAENDLESFFLVLDFRFLYSMPKEKLDNKLLPFLRIRQLLLSEIQSKLSRHINRQGILFLDT